MTRSTSGPTAEPPVTWSDPQFAGFSTFAASQWRDLVGNDLAQVDLDQLSGPVGPDAVDITDVYLPLCSVLGQMARARRTYALAVRRLTGTLAPGPSPFVVGVTGGVASGKSVCSRVLQTLLSSMEGGTGRLKVELLCTDSFLLPNAELEAADLLQAKGFPETYDIERLLDAVIAIRSGEPRVEIPVYSHAAYDIVVGESEVIRQPDVLIVEGLNVLQPAPRMGARGRLEVSDLLDTAVYVDATEDHMAKWFTERLLALRKVGPGDPSPFLRWFSSLSLAEALAVADQTWSEVNLVNLRRHVAPTRSRAEFVLHCGADHRVSDISVRTH
jgi:type I pantothenate kinase